MLDLTVMNGAVAIHRVGLHRALFHDRIVT